MNKKQKLLLIGITIIAILSILVVIGIYMSKKENFAEDNVQKAIKLSNYLGKRGVYLNQEPKLLKSSMLKHDLVKKQCPGGICPGLGQGFDLRKINIIDPKDLQSGTKIFKNLNILNNPECFQSGPYQSDKYSEFIAKSTNELISSLATANNISGSAPIQKASLTVTADTVSKSESRKVENIQTCMKSIVDGYASLNFLQGPNCRRKNLEPDFEKSIKELSKVKITDPYKSESWAEYKSFLNRWGTHVLTSVYFGSKIEIFESLESSNLETEKLLTIKACAKIHEDLSKVKAGTCGNFQKNDIEKANKTITKNYYNVLGGNDDIRRKISVIYKDGGVPDSALIEKFLKSSNESTQPITYNFQPIWNVLLSLSSDMCIDDTLEGLGTKSDSCNLIQMSINLEAAFAFDTIDCQLQTTSEGKVYQEFRASNSGTDFTEYECFAAKTGCTSSSKDCHFNTGGIGCIAYGQGALNVGPEYKLNPGNFRTIIQGNKGSTDPYEGINNSCHHGSWGCTCNYDWAGGLPDRQLWRTGQL
jgi:MAC/Perforin domain